MSVTGRAIFPLATVRKAFREARLPMRFFRVFRTRRIWRELITRRLLIAIWRRFCGAVPVLPKPTPSAGFNSMQRVRPYSGSASPKPMLKSRPFLRVSTFLNDACLHWGPSLKRTDANRNLKTSLVGSGDKGSRCNCFWNYRVRISWFNYRNFGAVFWSVGINRRDISHCRRDWTSCFRPRLGLAARHRHYRNHRRHTHIPCTSDNGVGDYHLYCGLGAYDWRVCNCFGNKDAPCNLRRMVSNSYGACINSLRGPAYVEFY